MPIIFDECGMVEQVKMNPVTTIGKEVCASHVVKVWEAISAFIVQTLCGGRAVRIPGLLTVTFKIIQIELSQRDTILQKNPHLILSSELALRHSLRVKKPPYNLDIPEVDLNLSVIAKICNMSRVHVEHCVEEVIHAFNRAIACDPHVELWLTKIGRVIVDCADVDVVFCSEFLNLLGYSEEFIQDKRCPVR